MPTDFFNPDPNAMGQFREHAEQTQAAMGKTRDFAAEINAVINDVNRAYTEIEKSGTALGISPETLAQIKSVHTTFVSTAIALKEVGKQQQDIEKNAKKIEKISKEEEKRRKKDLLVVRELRKVNKQLLADADRKKKFDEKAVATEKERKEEEKKKRAEQEGYLKAQAAAVATQTMAMAGLGGVLQRNKNSTLGWQLSLAGVLKVIIDLWDKSNKIAGYSKQAGYQFKEWGTGVGATSKAISTTSKTIWDLRSRFNMAFEDAGKMTAKLTQAGFEAEDMATSVARMGKGGKEYQSTASRMMAVQVAQGRSVDTQLQSVMNLRNNFGLLVTSAQTLDALIGEIGKNIPGLAPQQAVQDIEMMGKGMRFFNTDLLDSITLYHSLNNAAEDHRKLVKAAQEEATKTGKQYQAPQVQSAWGSMATAPLEQRQSMLQWISNAPMALDPGMMVALGKGKEEGGTAGERGMEFQKSLTPEEQGGTGKKGEVGVEFFKRAISYVRDMTVHIRDPFERQTAIMGLLQRRLGMQDKELAFRTAAGIQKGELTPEKMEAIVAEQKKLAEEMEAKAKAREGLMDKLLTTGEGINTNLKTLEERLSNWVTNNLLGPINQLKDALDRLAAKMPDLPKTKENIALLTGGSSARAEADYNAVKNQVLRTGPNLQKARGLNATFKALESVQRKLAEESAKQEGESIDMPGTFGLMTMADSFIGMRKLTQEQLVERFKGMSGPQKLLDMLQHSPEVKQRLLQAEVTATEIGNLVTALTNVLAVNASSNKSRETASNRAVNTSSAQKLKGQTVKAGTGITTEARATPTGQPPVAVAP